MEYLDKLENFSLFLGNEQKSKSTIKTYKSAVSRFLIDLQLKNKDILNYSESDILTYLEKQAECGLSKGSISKILPAINAFSSFMSINAEVNLREIHFLKEMNQDKDFKITVLSKNAQEKIYKHALRVWKKRNVSILLLILETGIKLSDLVSLNKEDLIKINDIPYITVHIKNKRTLPISETLYSHIIDTLSIRYDQCEALFISKTGKRIGERSVINIFHSHGNLSSQILRDTYIYNLIKNDVDTYIISRLAGITYIDTFIEKYYNNEFLAIDDFVENHI